jgi:hypothetical protein
MKEILELSGFSGIKIEFSGFWSQGDGASFTGHYSYKPGWRKAFLAYCPYETDILRYLDAIAAIQRRYFYKAGFVLYKVNNHYSHEKTVSLELTGGKNQIEHDTDLLDNCRYIMGEIYSRLEKEYDYTTSEESFIEISEANDWKYNEAGELE